MEGLKGLPPTACLTAAGVGLVALFALFAILRGVVRQLLRMVSLGLPLLAGAYVFQHPDELAGLLGLDLGTNSLLLLAGGTVVVAYFVCRSLVQILAGLGLLGLLGGLTGWKAGIVSLIPSGFLIWASSLVLRLVGSIYGLENAAAAQSGGAQPGEQASAWVHQLSQTVERSAFGSWLAMLDPFDRRATANLARLLILWPDGRVWEQLAERDPRAASALNHKHIVALGHDEEVRRAIEKQDYAGLLQLRQVIRAASTPELEPFLKGLELENAMDAFVYTKR